MHMKGRLKDKTKTQHPTTVWRSSRVALPRRTISKVSSTRATVRGTLAQTVPARPFKSAPMIVAYEAPRMSLAIAFTRPARS